MNQNIKNLFDDISEESRKALMLVCTFYEKTGVCLGVYHKNDSSFQDECVLCSKGYDDGIHDLEWNYFSDEDPNNTDFKTLSEKVVHHMLQVLKVKKGKSDRKSNLKETKEICEICDEPFDGKGIYKKCIKCNQKQKKDTCPKCKKKYDSKGKYRLCYDCNQNKYIT